MTIAGSPKLNRPLRSLAQANADAAEQAARRAHDRDARECVKRLCAMADRLECHAGVDINNNDPARYRAGYDLSSEVYAIRWIVQQHYPLIVAAYNARYEADSAPQEPGDDDNARVR
jgi:hypothetical protein